MLTGVVSGIEGHFQDTLVMSVEKIKMGIVLNEDVCKLTSRRQTIPSKWMKWEWFWSLQGYCRVWCIGWVSITQTIDQGIPVLWVPWAP